MAHKQSAVLAAVLACVPVFLEVARAGDDLPARRRRVAQMSPAEQQELLRKQHEFLALPAAERDRLRALQAAIDADPHAEALNRVLKQYHEWLKNISPGDRAELAEMSTEDRINRIKQIHQREQAAREQAQRAEVLTSKDMYTIRRWAENVLWENRERVFKEMPNRDRKKLEQENEERQRRSLLFVASYWGRRSGAHPMTLVEQKHVDALRAKLSPAARDELIKAPNLTEQRKIVGGWIAASMQRLASWRGSRRSPAMVEEELTQFFEQELSPRDRDRLLKMSNERMRAELRHMYFDPERWERSERWEKRDRKSPRDGRPSDHRKGHPRKGPRNAADTDGRDKSQAPSSGAGDGGPRGKPGEGAQR